MVSFELKKKLLTVSKMSILHVFVSLAVHPDKITIATGQVAGTSSDGKVSIFLYFTLSFCFRGAWVDEMIQTPVYKKVSSFLMFLHECCLAAAGSTCSCMGLRQPQHPSRVRCRVLWQSSSMPCFFQVGTETPSMHFWYITVNILNRCWTFTFAC